jgi:hypothetical protein
MFSISNYRFTSQVGLSAQPDIASSIGTEGEFLEFLSALANLLAAIFPRFRL